MIDIQELKRLAQLATPGPWKLDSPRESFMRRNRSPDERMMYSIDGPKGVSDHEDWGYSKAEAEYMAAADPTTLLALLARLERAEMALAQVASLKRYDPNRDRSNAGRTVTVNAPAAVMQALDEAISGVKP